MRRWPVPLWLELCAAFLVALLVSNAVTFAVAEHRRSSSIRAERIGAIEDRLSALVGLLARLPESERGRLLTIASVRHERVSIGATPRVADDAERDFKAEERLKAALLPEIQLDVRVAKRGTPSLSLVAPRKRGGQERYTVAVGLGPRQWLNAEFHWPEGEALLPGLIFSSGVAALALVFVAVWTGFRLSGPLQHLALASSVMQTGRAADPIPETGPRVLRGAAQAFNLMSQRLMSMVDNQRALLASVGHDLRSPITSLRLKSEFVGDDELREQFLRSLDELQSLTEAALDAARNGLGGEECRNVDIEALVESMCSDLSDQGHDVAFTQTAPVFGVCRPNEIRRAARNLVENAVKYGERARVCVRGNGQAVCVQVDDDGPGLPESDRARAFEPFVRLTAVSGEAKSGHGLGLTLARGIARAHGGDVRLENRPGGGLCAVLSLRLSAQAVGGQGKKPEVRRL